MKSVALILLLTLSWPSLSQISLTQIDDWYCTDSIGARKVAKALKELEFSRKELILMDSIILAQSNTIGFFNRVLTKQDSVEKDLVRQVHKEQERTEKAKKERWWFAGGGFVLALILILL